MFTNSWVTTNDYLDKHHDTVVKFLKAWLRGTEDRYNNMEATVQKVADYIGTDYETAYLTVEKTNWINNAKLKELVEDGTAMKWYDTLKSMFLDDRSRWTPMLRRWRRQTFVKFDCLKEATGRSPGDAATPNRREAGCVQAAWAGKKKNG